MNKISFFRVFLKINHKKRYHIPISYLQGQRNEFYPGVARVIRKMRFCEFSKFLLCKFPILGVARATPATPVPRPLGI